MQEEPQRHLSTDGAAPQQGDFEWPRPHAGPNLSFPASRHPALSGSQTTSIRRSHVRLLGCCWLGTSPTENLRVLDARPTSNGALPQPAKPCRFWLMW